MRERDINGRILAERILDGVSRDVLELRIAGWSPTLVSICVGEASAVDLYIRNQRRAAERVGIAYEEKRFSADVTYPELRAAIGALNANPRVTGIILQRPIPSHLRVRDLQAAIHPMKDVEGMHPASIGNIVYGNELAPCTALAAVEILKSTGLSMQGLEAVVVGHSEIVGKPIAFLLMAEGATVTVCHHMTRSVAVHSRRADAVFVAVGRPGLVRGEMIKPGAVVIDIGINQIEENGRLRVVGDVDYVSCAAVAGWITPVPGGVGPVTVAMLMRNTVTAVRRLKGHYEAEFGDAWTTSPLEPGEARLARAVGS